MTPAEVRTFFDLPPLPPSPDPAQTDRPRYNVAPTQPVLALVADESGGRAGRWLTWSFVPPAPGRAPLINARAETVLERSTFRESARMRRCAIPADGFFEWQTLGPRGRTKQPFHVRPRATEPWLFAGLWRPWPKGGAGLAILTVAASSEVATLHDRMPLVLKLDRLDAWLDPRRRRPDELEVDLSSEAETDLEVIPVSKRVSSVEHDDPECIEPIEFAPGPDELNEETGTAQLGFGW